MTAEQVAADLRRTATTGPAAVLPRLLNGALRHTAVDAVLVVGAPLGGESSTTQ
jgi:hypothetical protein